MITRTQLAILNAFNDLIRIRDFDAISVKEIVEHAFVSKATFYRYFKDKYDVMNLNYKLQLDRCLHSENVHGYRDLFEAIDTIARTDLRELVGVYRSAGVNSFDNYIFQYSRDTVVDITRLNRDEEGLTEKEEYQLDAFCAGVCQVFRKWIAGEWHLSSREAAEALFELMPPTLKDYWYPAT